MSAAQLQVAVTAGHPETSVVRIEAIEGTVTDRV
jgi:hypothetical protein